jgi:hypothetical protein
VHRIKKLEKSGQGPINGCKAINNNNNNNNNKNNNNSNTENNVW